MSGTEVMPGVVVKEVVDESLARTYSLIAFNDDVTPFMLVIMGIAMIGVEVQRAEELTNEIHHKGSAVVKSGMSKDEVVQAYNVVKEITKGGGRYPGIEMQMVEDSAK
jgi:ATP-dependent Clp protease adapter protein ClpS